MTERVLLKPRAGLRLRLETGEPWPEAGEWADPHSLYVRRRLADGDLEPVPAPETADGPAPSGATKTKGSARA